MTTITKPPSADFFRTTPAKGVVGKVDRLKGIIYGASIIQIGPLNDSRPWRVDQGTLEQTVEMGSRGNKGLKARFTHPDMSNDGMGKYLGRWKNLRIDGDRVRGDLHFAKSAYETPDGNLAKYVMDLAEEDPHMFGVSVAPRNDDEAMNKERDKQTDPKMRTPIRYLHLYAADVVDEPAATRGGFFSQPWDDTSTLSALPAQAATVLDRYFANAAPDVVRTRVLGFLDKYLSHKEEDVMSGTNAGGAPATKKEPISVVWNEALGKYELPAGIKPEDLGLTPATATVTDPPPPVVTATDPPPKSDLAKVIENPALAENTRVREITALCLRAGLSSDLANKMIADLNCTVEQARGNVLESVLAKRHALPPEENNDPGGEQTQSVDEKLSAEYTAAEAKYVKAGLSKEDYIASRKIDLGLALLEPAKK